MLPPTTGRRRYFAPERLRHGWGYFSHSARDTTLTAIDGDPPNGNSVGRSEIPAMIEVHGHRCGRHLGQRVHTKGKGAHCVNHIALDFRASA